MLGGSYGGYSALVATTTFAGAHDAGVSSVGISNLLTLLQNTAPYRRILRTTEYGDPERDRDALIELLIFADEGHGAGKRENRVPMVGHALRFMDEHLKPRSSK